MLKEILTTFSKKKFRNEYSILRFDTKIFYKNIFQTISNIIFLIFHFTPFPEKILTVVT